MDKKQFADWICENVGLSDFLDTVSDLTLDERPQPEKIAEAILYLLSDEGFNQIKEMYKELLTADNNTTDS